MGMSSLGVSVRNILDGKRGGGFDIEVVSFGWENFKGTWARVKLISRRAECLRVHSFLVLD